MVSPCQDVLDLFMQLPIGKPHTYTLYERGQDDGYYGREPAVCDPGYRAGYALGLEMLELRKEVRRAKEAQTQEQHVHL